MNKDLEIYIHTVETRFNLRTTIEHMGFKKVDRDYYIKYDHYNVYAILGEKDLMIWSEATEDHIVIKNYIEIYNELDKGICTIKEFVNNALNFLSN